MEVNLSSSISILPKEALESLKKPYPKHLLNKVIILSRIFKEINKEK